MDTIDNVILKARTERLKNTDINTSTTKVPIVTTTTTEEHLSYKNKKGLSNTCIYACGIGIGTVILVGIYFFSNRKKNKTLHDTQYMDDEREEKYEKYRKNHVFKSLLGSFCSMALIIFLLFMIRKLYKKKKKNK